jgi:hypothetical protein
MYSTFRGLPNNMMEKRGIQAPHSATLDDRFPFETALHRRAPECAVHVFHSTSDLSNTQDVNSGFVMHPDEFLATSTKQGESSIASTLQGHMQRLGHSQISLLRIDTPVALNALPQALLANPEAGTAAERWGNDDALPKQIQIQFYTGGHEMNETMTQVRRVMDTLVERYVLFHIDVPPTPSRIHTGPRTKDWWLMQTQSTVEVSFIHRRYAVSPFHVPVTAVDFQPNPWTEEMMRSYGCGKRAVHVTTAKLAPDGTVQVPLRAY